MGDTRCRCPMNESRPPSKLGSDNPTAQLLAPTKLLGQLADDLCARWQRGERVRVEQYLEQYPDLQAAPEAIDLVYAEYLLRREAGEAPTPDEYIQRFPGMAGALREHFAFHGFVEGGLFAEPLDASSPTMGGGATKRGSPATDEGRYRPLRFHA